MVACKGYDIMLQRRIELLRKKLSSAMSCGRISHDEIYQLSMELDGLICQFYNENSEYEVVSELELIST